MNSYIIVVVIIIINIIIIIIIIVLSSAFPDRDGGFLLARGWVNYRLCVSHV